MEDGDNWPDELADALRTSRYLLAVLSPTYFTSRWCMAEWETMRAREKLLGIPQPAESFGLIYSVVFSGSEMFPPEVRERQLFDLSPYGFPYERFRRTDAYLEFHAKVREIAADLVKRFESAPPWRPDWPVLRPDPYRGERASPPAGLDQGLKQRYDRLPDVAAALLRRGTLAGGQALDPEIADLLVNGGGQEAIDALLASSLFIRLPDGCADYYDQIVRSFAEQLLEDREDQATINELREKVRRWLLVNRQYPPEPRIARDYWTTQDGLNYAAYADAIAAFIRHPSTLPPLTIGIKAPWGAGKTSLMRMVQERLDPPLADNGTRARIRLTRSSRQGLLGRRNWRLRRSKPSANAAVTNAEVLGRARQASAQRGPPPLHADPETDLRIPSTGWHPTVWFNPWIYQSGEQVWAGLAHEIIRQVTDRLPRGDRERFWLELNLARLDRDAVRRRGYRAVWERVLPFLIIFVLAVVVSLFMFAIGRITRMAWLTGLGSIAGGSGAVALLGAAWSAARFLNSTAAGPLSSLVQGPDLVRSSHTLLRSQFAGSFDLTFPDPGYGTKLGFLHLVQIDMKRVLDLVAREDQPLVIFIDDLDRCSPGTVAQVIEAINLFLAGEFPNCLFVLAMEPALVAAHVEVTYKDLVKALKRGRSPGEWSTLGWRFLEKIVQLPLSLPPPPVVGGVDRYLATLLNTTVAFDGAERSTPDNDRRTGSDSPALPTSASSAQFGQTRGGTPPPGLPNPALVEQIADGIRARHPGIATLPDVARRVQAEVVPEAGADPLLPETTQAVDRVFANLYSDTQALSAIEAALPALSSTNPREIKRYINLFRFYTFIVQRQRLDGLSAPSSDCIAKLAALAIRWPHLLSTLSQTRFIAILEQAGRSSEDDEAWCEALRNVGLTKPPKDGVPEALPEWSEHLRAFLAAGPQIGEVAARLL